MSSLSQQSGARVSPGSFPCKLHNMLDELETEGMASIVSWQPHGRCFVVHNRKEFVQIMPSFFSMSKFSSFQRQLNLYGFERLTHGKDTRGYYHPCFLRGKRELSKSIVRQQVKGTGVRKPATPEKEPHFYLMDFMPAALVPASDNSNTWSPGTGVNQSIPSILQSSLQLNQEQNFRPIEVSRNFASHDTNSQRLALEQAPSVKPLRNGLNPLLASHYAYLAFFGSGTVISTFPAAINPIQLDASTQGLGASLSLSRSLQQGHANEHQSELQRNAESILTTGEYHEKLFTSGVQAGLSNEDISCNQRKQGDQLEDDAFFETVLDLCNMD